MDGDGYPDIFASNHRQLNSLYLNRGDGTFHDTGDQVLSWRNRSGADTHGASWTDFDNDGDQDLLVSAGVGNLNQLLVNEFGRLVDRTVERGLTMIDIGGRLPVWLDYDGDSLSDFVMTQYAGIARLFRQDSSGVFTQTTSDAKLLCSRFHYGQLLEVTFDGRLDFLCADETAFPQKIFDTVPLPWSKVYDSKRPAPFLPVVPRSPIPSWVTSTTTAPWTCSCWAAFSCAPRRWTGAARRHSRRISRAATRVSASCRREPSR